jgi:hypothetical protein
VEEAPEIFLPIPGGWGKVGHTHIRLAAASEDVLTDALRKDHDPLSTDNDRHVRTEPYSCHSLFAQVALSDPGAAFGDDSGCGIVDVA